MYSDYENEELNNSNKDENDSKKKLLNIFLGVILALVVLILFSHSSKNTQDSKQTVSSKSNKTTTSKRSGSVPGAMKIPDEVYENTTKQDALANVIFADKKVIYHSYLGGCPISESYLRKLEGMMSQNPNIKNYYYYYPDPQGSSTMVVCKNTSTNKCVQNYLFRQCGQDICIVNGPKKEIVRIDTSDPKNAYIAIEEFINW